MLHYLLLMVPGKNRDGMIKKRPCKLAECLADETERSQAPRLDNIPYDDREQFEWKVVERGHEWWKRISVSGP